VLINHVEETHRANHCTGGK